MKRILSLVLILILSVAALTACEFPFPWGDKAPSYDLDNAKGAVVELYPALVATKDNPVPNTIDNYNLTKVLPLKDGTYTIEWNTDNVNVQVKDYVPVDENDVNTAENTATVHVPERPETGEADITYTLRALITAPDGSTTYVLFNLKVPALNPNTFAEFMAAEKDAFITVSGVVTAIQRKADGNQDNGVYFQDADGGYYAYQVDDAAMEGLEIGMTVVVSGKRGTYGVAQITSPSLKVIDTTIKTVEPIDFTDLVKNADKLTNAELLAKNSVLVTIKGATLAEAGDNGYYYFLIGDHKVYFRISGSNNPMTADEKAALIKAHADNKGATADITGLVNAYNGVFYLTPAGSSTITNIVASTCEHTGGTATCKDLAVCDLCGVTYGDYADHVEGTAATCTSLAKCSVCEKTYGALGAHTFTDGVCTCGATNVLSTDAEYYFAMYQGNKNGLYYFTGAMDGFYFGASTSVADAVKVKLVAVEGVDGAYHISFVDAQGNTKYLSVYERDGKPASSSLAIVDAAPANYFTYNTEYNTFVCTFTNSEGNEVSFFLGTNGTYETISGSAVKYLAQGNFVASLYVVSEGGNEGGDQPGEGGEQPGEGGGETPDQPGEGGGETPSAPTTVEEILNALYALSDGETLAGSFTLTGEITALDSYNNPTIVIEGFESKPVYCFKLKDNRFVVGATITVTATTLKNYKGTYELEGCTLVEIVLPEGTEQPEEGGETPSTPANGYSYTFVSGVFTADGTVSLGGKNWTLTTVTSSGADAYFGFDTDSNTARGFQFGKGKDHLTSMTLVSESFTNVTKIVINTSGAKDINGSFEVYVGDVKVGDSTTLTNSATEYTFECSSALTGEVKIVYTNSAKAIYIKSIQVVTAE